MCLILVHTVVMAAYYFGIASASLAATSLALAGGSGMALRSSTPPSIYGTSWTGGLIKIDGTTGKLTPEGPDHPEEATAQELSTIDKGRGKYYILGYNVTTGSANLVGWDINTHAVTVDEPVDLLDYGFIVRSSFARRCGCCCCCAVALMVGW